MFNSYKQIYQDVSSWMHWSPSVVGAHIHCKNNHVVYVNIATDKAAMALSSGFQSLIETAAVADSHLSLGFADRLVTLRETYIKGLLPTLQSFKTQIRRDADSLRRIIRKDRPRQRFNED
jgi:hypothetical protein